MISIEVRGEAAIKETLSTLAKTLNRSDILDESGALLLNIIRTRYKAETSPYGKKWEQSKAARLENRATLYKTGRLYHSIQLAATGPSTRAIGTDVRYGPFHQFGTGRMPRRMFLGFNDEDAILVEKLIVSRLRRAGLV